jgi:hypothetical protein
MVLDQNHSQAEQGDLSLSKSSVSYRNRFHNMAARYSVIQPFAYKGQSEMA